MLTGDTWNGVRDYFAGIVMQLLLSSPTPRNAFGEQVGPNLTPEEVAEGAYRMADAMMAERARKATDA
jgi:hypothetical protein